MKTPNQIDHEIKIMKLSLACEPVKPMESIKQMEAAIKALEWVLAEGDVPKIDLVSRSVYKRLDTQLGGG